MPRSDRSRIQHMLFDPLWIGATDYEISAHLRTAEAHVAEVRREFVACKRIATAATKAAGVVEAALALRNSGYDGVFLSDATEDLFRALRRYESG